MKNRTLTTLVSCAAMCMASLLHAQTPSAEFRLWPNGAPTSNGLTGPEVQLVNHVTNVTQPTLRVFLPEHPNGLAVLACPGGGYVDVWDGSEGVNLAEWYNQQGIVYAVLKYRLPNGHREVPLDDVHEAMRILREHADDYGFVKLGIQGCSAGGHLAATASTHFTKPEQRPDFQILFYPVITLDSTYTHMGSRHYLLGDDAPDSLVAQYCNELQVTPDTPPAFIMASSDDGLVPVRNSVEYYNALVRNRVSATMHLYPIGGHGWCGNTQFLYRTQWMQELSHWLEAEIQKK